MSSKGFTALLLFVFVFLIIAFSQGNAAAQSSAFLRISEPEVDQFPTVSFSLSIADASGKHIPGLSSSNLVILEDGKPIHGVHVEENVIGTRQIFILNTTRNMRGRDSLGLTQFDYVRHSLLAWWSMPESSEFGIDDLTLLTDDRSIVEETSLSAQLAASLSSFEPEYEDVPASFDKLLEALNLVSDAPPEAYLPTHIIFITPLVLEPEGIPLTDTIAQAKELGARIYPILVGPEDILDYPEMENMRLLAEATGGELVIFDPEAGLEALAEQILSHRSLYQVTYTSQVNTSGAVQLQVQATSDGVDAISEPRTFAIDVSPPQVAFILPPEKIVREATDPEVAPEVLSPSETSLKVLITYPDSHDRPIVHSQLMVNDGVIDENFTPPFDTFDWDLDGYTTTETYILQVLVEDSLGLQGLSMITPVEVEVNMPPGPAPDLESLIGTILPVVGVLASAIIISIFIFNYAKPRLSGSLIPESKTGKAPSRRQRVALGREKNSLPAEGVLQAESEGIADISLVGTDIVLGSDSTLSAIHMDDPSVSGLHARVTRLANGRYLIKDQGSTAGTWVNFEPVPEDGRLLNHGDLINLGRIQFRFILNDPPAPKEIRISAVDEL